LKYMNTAGTEIPVRDVWYSTGSSFAGNYVYFTSRPSVWDTTIGPALVRGVPPPPPEPEPDPLGRDGHRKLRLR
jgi:hypothetical protein